MKMNSTFSVQNHIVHLWRASLTELLPQEQDFRALLSSDELDRADRFRFEKHRQRFTIARGVLRSILALYTQELPQNISFSYGPRGKPALNNNTLKLQFNVSHSEDKAVYAFTREAEIGIDIEKIEPKFKDGVAKRFFSEQENHELLQLPETERVVAFYQLWAAKEALIKAVGEGLYVPLNGFSIDLSQKTQWINLEHHQRSQPFWLENFIVFDGFSSAFAMSQPVGHVITWEWLGTGPMQSWSGG